MWTECGPSWSCRRRWGRATRTSYLRRRRGRCRRAPPCRRRTCAVRSSLSRSWLGDFLSGTADDDVALGGAGAHFDGWPVLVRPDGGGEVVQDLTGGGVGVQPGRGALADADLEVAVCGLYRDLALHHLGHPHGAVGSLRDDVGMRPLHDDASTGRVGEQVVMHLADPGLAVRVLHHGRAADVPYP